MKDIFGYTVGQYKTLHKLRTAGLLESQLEARVVDWFDRTGLHSKPHDFGFAGGSLKYGNPIAFKGEGVLGYFTDNMQAIITMIDEILYRSDRLREYVPIRTDVPEGDTSYAVRYVDYVGQGRFVGNQGSDIPTVAMSQRKVSTNTYVGALGFIFTREDIRNAQRSGVPFETGLIKAAVRGYMNHAENVGFEGDLDIPNSKGLTNQVWDTSNNDYVANRRIAHATKSWTATSGGLTEDEKFNILQKSISNIIVNTNEIVLEFDDPDICIALPPEIYNDVVVEPFGDNKDKTLADFIMAKNAWKARTGKDVVFKSLTNCTEAGSLESTDSSNNITSRDRIITYVKSMDAMEYAIVFPARPIEPQYVDLGVKTLLEYKLGSFQVKRRHCLEYVDTVP